jgi:hypothetical protein
LFRIVNRKEYDRVINNTKEGIQSIRNLKYTIKEIDNTYSYVNVSNFSTEIVPDLKENKVHDLRTGLKPFINNKSVMINTNKYANTNTNTNTNTNIKRRGIMRMFHM